MINQIISHYKILKKLGEGGMGEVYLAEDQKLDRSLALKFLSPFLVQNPDARKRFFREARSVAALNHPNICTIYDVCEEDGHVFIAMEYVKGHNLLDEIKEGPLPLERAVEIACQVGQGLLAAHKNGIVHRDIKSANIMITESGHVKIMDFGLARSLDQTRMTKENTSIGTIAYMSFEQASGRDTDHRTDIWSFGVVLFEMITGKLPFPGEADQVIIYSILNKEPASVRNLSEPLDRIIGRALEKEPGNRYQRVDDLLNDLEQLHKQDRQKFRPKRKKTGIKKLFQRTGFILRWIVPALIILYGLYFFMRRDREIQSIAVLPLKNLSGNPDQVYFVEGMQDALITRLSQISALRVISKISTMPFAETQKSVPQIARELNVDALVTGSVLCEKNQIRISAQLIRGSTDQHLWAQSYDRELHQALPLISEITRSIADEIEIVVNPDELKRIEQVETVSMPIRELVYKGRYYFDRFQFRKSLASYQEAAEQAPDFAPAYAGIAMSYMIMGFFGWEPIAETIPKARAAVYKSLSLDNHVAEAYATLGYIQLYHDWDWPAARENLLRALELDPNDAIMRHAYADYLLVMGDVEGSLKQVQIGHLNDPLSPMAGMMLRYHLYMTPGHDEILADCKNMLELNPDDATAGMIYRNLLWEKGMYDEALDEFRKTWGKDAEFLKALERGYKKAGHTGAIRTLAQTVVRRVPEYNDYFTIAQLYTQAGVNDSALVWLEHAYENHQFELLHVKAWPVFKSLHIESGFQDLLNRIGFPENP